ncbi:MULTISPECIES: hypothetical protein [Streptomyces]|uniref:Uncharacterized protein n=1 Tax=Streptomyces yunnanensis TaxID=156453 RepID=A0ABY8A735_9ACTN|nr:MULTISPECIES: hypothetical protein [Streptomyces]WEB40777.1 hypothetical protein MOV08_16820 [Streptomyces yunnanensis]
MNVHHHGYTWAGSGSEYGTDSLRRPGNPQFAAASVVPLEPANWLLKNASFAKGTFHDADESAAWFGKQIADYADRFDGFHAKDPETLQAQVNSARETVDQGRDVVGGWWINGGTTFYAVHLIACPNFFRPEHPCPKRLR